MSVTLESKVLNGQLITPANGAPASGDYVAMQPASGSGTFLSVLSDSCKCVLTVVYNQMILIIIDLAVYSSILDRFALIIFTATRLALKTI